MTSMKADDEADKAIRGNNSGDRNRNQTISLIWKCERGDSNPHAVKHRNLNHVPSDDDSQKTVSLRVDSPSRTAWETDLEANRSVAPTSAARCTSRNEHRATTRWA